MEAEWYRATGPSQLHYGTETFDVTRTDAAATTGMRDMVVRRRVITDPVPIPEMIGGAIIGAVASMVLTYSAELRNILVPSSPVLYITVAVAALIGAVVSFFLARERAVEVKEQVEPAEAAARRAA